MSTTVTYFNLSTEQGEDIGNPMGYDTLPAAKRAAKVLAQRMMKPVFIKERHCDGINDWAGRNAFRVVRSIAGYTVVESLLPF